MRDIQNWVNDSAQQVIFLYGKNDPWSAGALEVSAAAQSRYVRKYIAPAGNHPSNLLSLTKANRL